MTANKKQWYFQIKIAGFELFGIYGNVQCDNSKTILGLRLLDGILLGLCRNEMHYFLDCTVLIFPNFHKGEPECQG